MKRVAFLGSKVFGLEVLKRLADRLPAAASLVGVVCPEDSSDSRSVLADFKSLTGDLQLSLDVVATHALAEQKLAAWAPHLVIVAGWYWLLPIDRFASSRFFGFHSSPLPRYRGGAPVVWQIMQGERQIGLSFFQMGSGIDEGDIVGQRFVPLADDETIADALQRLQAAAVELISTHIHDLIHGTAVLAAQDHSRATYCANRVPEDGHIDWSASAKRVHDFVRAQSRPYPGAFCDMPDGRRLRIWRTEVHPRPYLGAPGAVVQRLDSTVVVTCGEGAVNLLETQVDGEGQQVPAKVLPSIRIRLR